jgi:hypothetical protein
MSSTCFQSDGSSSGRRLYIQLWYGTFDMQWYKQSLPKILCVCVCACVCVRACGKEQVVLSHLVKLPICVLLGLTDLWNNVRDRN